MAVEKNVGTSTEEWKATLISELQTDLFVFLARIEAPPRQFYARCHQHFPPGRGGLQPGQGPKKPRKLYLQTQIW
jgi:hypothetical protein